MKPSPPTFYEHVCKSESIALFSAIAGLALVLSYDTASMKAWYQSENGQHSSAVVPAWQLRGPQEWSQMAHKHAADGDFQIALDTINYALLAAPKDANLLNFKGNMLESLFRFRDAQRVYEQALRADPAHADARQNLVLCQRINRYKGDPLLHQSSLYALHRVMLSQHRMHEDLVITRRLSSDHVAWQATWQAALDQTGLRGKITVDEGGAMALDLTGCRQPDLALIQEFPITSLNLAYTGLTHLRALQGMRLESLDLSCTLVDDLSPLRDMPLKVLRLPRTGVTDLSPLAGCPLQELDLSGTRIFDLHALAHLPLTTLRATDTPINDLRDLAALPLTQLYLSHTRVRDLGALRHLPLQILAVENTTVFDLSPLRGSPLKALYLASTWVSDLSPLARMPLAVLTLSDCRGANDLRPLASCMELEHLLVPPHPRFLEALAGLPRLHFVQGNETKFEEMLMMSCLIPTRVCWMQLAPAL